MKKLLILLLLTISICGYATVAGASGSYYRPHRHPRYVARPQRHHYVSRRHYVAPQRRRHYYRSHRRYSDKQRGGSQVRIRVGDENASVRMRFTL
jgi:hypothetical protein